MLSTWIRESPSLLAYPVILTAHAVGMGFLVGACAAMDFRILGFAPKIPVASTEALVPVMRCGFWLNAVSGALLLIGFPSKHLTNPVFHLKLLLIAIALLNTSQILKHVIRKSPPDAAVVPPSGKIMAGASLALWMGAVVAGRLLYYTFVRLSPSGKPY